MNEKITEFQNLRKIVHRIYCDECNNELQSIGVVYPTYPPQYPYICPKCKIEYSLDRNYPWSEIVGDEI